MALTAKIRQSFERINGFPLSQAHEVISSGCLPKKDKIDRSLDILGRGDPSIKDRKTESMVSVDEANLELVNKLAQYSRR